MLIDSFRFPKVQVLLFCLNIQEVLQARAIATGTEMVAVHMIGNTALIVMAYVGWLALPSDDESPYPFLGL